MPTSKTYSRSFSPFDDADYGTTSGRSAMAIKLAASYGDQGYNIMSSWIEYTMDDSSCCNV